MARIDIIKALYKKQIPIDQFKFDNLRCRPLYSYIHPYAVFQLNKIATSIKYQSKPKKKYELINDIVKPYGFKRIAAGTNRVVYKHIEDQGIVLKVALDKVGLNDNPSEYYNQQFLKPFVTKCFEISPCGTVGLFERVQPITSKAEFISVSDDIFALLNKMIGKYILEDIGTKFFMNYGLREGFGPVLLDYPYMFELDGKKIHCNNPDPFTGLPCNGEIDYDDGFNNLICTKCGKVYLATELQKDMDRNNIIIESDPNEKGEIFNMKIELVERSYDSEGRVIKEETKSEIGNGVKETSSILSKDQYNEGMKVEIQATTKGKIYRNDTIKAKPKFKIEVPRVRAGIANPTEAEENQETVSHRNEERTDEISPAERNKMRNDPLRKDVFGNFNKKKKEKEEENLKPISSESVVNEDYIKNELMGKDNNEESNYEKEALNDY